MIKPIKLFAKTLPLLVLAGGLGLTGCDNSAGGDNIAGGDESSISIESLDAYGDVGVGLPGNQCSIITVECHPDFSGMVELLILDDDGTPITSHPLYLDGSSPAKLRVEGEGSFDFDLRFDGPRHYVRWNVRPC